MSDARPAWGLFFGALLVRLAVCLGTEIFGTDSAQFLLMAQWMGEGRFHEALSITYHPLYPLLAAAVAPLTGSLEAAAYAVSVLLGSAAVVPLYHLAREIFGRPQAFIAGLIYVFQPHAAELHADVMTEGTFTFFFIGAAWLCWKQIEAPSFAKSILAGLLAAGAYLTRPEGLLAVALVTAWPLVEAVRRRERLALRLGGAAAGLAIALLVAFPYLLWIHRQDPQGRWPLSPKATAQGAQAGAVHGDPAENRLAKFGKSVARMTYLTGPFILLGSFGLRGLRGPLFFLSFPLGYLAGMLYALRAAHSFSYRYVVPPMAMLMALAGVGLVMAVGWIARRWPDPRRWVPASVALVAVVTIPMGLPLLRVHRADEAGVREASLWLKAQGAREVYSTTDKVGYFIGRPVRAYEPTEEEFRKSQEKRGADFFVYLERDLKKGEPPYLGRFREIRAFPDPPRRGVAKVIVASSR